MEHKIESFENQEFGRIRTVTVEGEPWFVAVDVCRALEVKNGRAAVSRLDDDERMTVALTDGHSGQRGGAQQINIVSESGLYTLVLGSRKPEAKDFRRWITHSVIPSIRKHGAYAASSVLNDPEAWGKVMQALREEAARSAELEAENAQHKSVIRRLRPKADYYDVILQSRSAVPITLFAKDYGMSATRLNRILHALEIQYKVGGGWMLYQKYAGKGYTVTHTYISSPGHSTMHTCWTQRGRVFLYELLAEHGILPVTET